MSTKPRHTVAFDEAGNTGQNLLDAEQPVSVLASVFVEEGTAAELVRPLQPRGAREAKFARRRGPEFDRAVIDLVNSDFIERATVKVGMYHKRFMLTTKIVDLLVEPMMYRMGHNLYAQARNHALANLLHAVTPIFCGPGSLDELHRRFMVMVREKSVKNIGMFYIYLARLCERSTSRSFAETLTVVSATEPYANGLLDEWDLTALEPALPAFAELAAHWTATLDGRFDILHDDSKPLARERAKPLARERERLEKLMRQDVEPFEVERGGVGAVFPIAADRLRFVGSHEYPQVQLADILAGALRRAARARILHLGDPLAEPVLRSRLVTNGGFWAVWPDTAITPKQLGTETWDGAEALNRVTDLFS